MAFEGRNRSEVWITSNGAQGVLKVNNQ